MWSNYTSVGAKFYGSKLVTRIGSLAKVLVGTYTEKEFENNRVFYKMSQMNQGL